MEELLDPVLLPDRVDVGDAVVREVREVKVDLEEIENYSNYSLK